MVNHSVKICSIRLSHAHAAADCARWLQAISLPAIALLEPESSTEALAALSDLLDSPLLPFPGLIQLHNELSRAEVPGRTILYQLPDTMIAREHYALAAELAIAFEQDTLALWLSAEGPHCADIAYVPHALPIAELSFDEARELAAFNHGHLQHALESIATTQLAILLYSTHQGTLSCCRISSSPASEPGGVRALVSRTNLRLLSLRKSSSAAEFVSQIELISRLAHSEISVPFLCWGLADATCSLAVRADDAQEIVKHLEQAENIPEYQLSDEQYSILGVVGSQMRDRAGLSGRIFSTLGKNGVSAVAIAQASSEFSISIAIRSADLEKALTSLHDALFLEARRTVHLLLIGPGAVGKTVLSHIEQRAKRYPQVRSSISVVGMARRSGYCLDAAGVSLDQLENNPTEAAGAAVEECIEQFINLNLPHRIVIDATASDEVPHYYPRLLANSISVVTPNKRGLTSEYSCYSDNRALARQHNAKWYYETTVGAGLPIIGTLHDLLASGDKILKIEAVLSGTLSYLWNTYDASQSFAHLVRAAQGAGYTEPDPRDDLSGEDVRRKLLILARESGATLELSAISLTPAVPQRALTSGSIEDFYTRLEDCEDEIADQYHSAARGNARLRYIARFEQGQGEIRLATVSRDHPFYQLAGTDNILAITTERYEQQPLVVRGPGAGLAVTAAGVLADVLRVASYLD